MALFLIAKNKLRHAQNKIALAKEQGVRVVLASGRPIDGMRSKLEELELTSDQDYVLHYNGSMVQNVATGEVIYK